MRGVAGSLSGEVCSSVQLVTRKLELQEHFVQELILGYHGLVGQNWLLASFALGLGSRGSSCEEIQYLVHAEL